MSVIKKVKNSNSKKSFQGTKICGKYKTNGVWTNTFFSHGILHKIFWTKSTKFRSRKSIKTLIANIVYFLGIFVNFHFWRETGHYNISHKLSRPSQFLEKFMKILEWSTLQK